MAKSRQGGYESSSKPAEELCTPPRGPAPGAEKASATIYAYTERDAPAPFLRPGAWPTSLTATGGKHD